MRKIERIPPAFPPVTITFDNEEDFTEFRVFVKKAYEDANMGSYQEQYATELDIAIGYVLPPV